MTSLVFIERVNGAFSVPRYRPKHRRYSVPKQL
jgi:hypothetical protein